MDIVTARDGCAQASLHGALHTLRPVALQGSWFVRALCYDSLNQPKPALEAYQKFLELDQNKNPDQVWQAQERSKVLRRMLEGKK